MGRASYTTWFAGLRRDRGLFAVVASLVMLLNVLQPLTAAQAGEAGGWVICTIYGAEKPVDADDIPTAWPENCPICLAGNGCSSAAPGWKALLSPEPAFPAPPAFAGQQLISRSVLLPAQLAGDPPPAIRAPPLSA